MRYLISIYVALRCTLKSQLQPKRIPFLATGGLYCDTQSFLRRICFTIGKRTLEVSLTQGTHPSRQPIFAWWNEAMMRIRTGSREYGEHPPASSSSISTGSTFQKVLHLPNSQSLCHYHNKVHGGLQSTIIDEAMAEACSPAVTAFIHPTFWAPLAPGTSILVEVEITKVEGRKRWVVGRIMSLGFGHDRKRTLFTDAVGLFVVERNVWETMQGAGVTPPDRADPDPSFEAMRQAEIPLLEEATSPTTTAGET